MNECTWEVNIQESDSQSRKTSFTHIEREVVSSFLMMTEKEMLSKLCKLLGGIEGKLYKFHWKSKQTMQQLSFVMSSNMRCNWCGSRLWKVISQPFLFGFCKLKQQVKDMGWTLLWMHLILQRMQYSMLANAWRTWNSCISLSIVFTK